MSHDRDADILIRTFPHERIDYEYYNGRNNELRPAVQVPEHQVRFTSGATVCVEALRDGRWIGRYWTADGRVNFQYEYLRGDAFALEIDGELLSEGWKWVSGEETAPTDRGCRHCVVELSSATRPIPVRLHTLVDCTAILEPRLEINNTGEKPAPLTAVAPWCGQSWYRPYYNRMPPQSYDPLISLGTFAMDRHGYEGWLEWEALEEGTRTVESCSGRGFDDPFFILRDDMRGEYFIGHLAWSANWMMEFPREKDPSGKCDGIYFSIGPMADAALHVIALGETVTTPAVHLASWWETWTRPCRRCTTTSHVRSC